MQEIIIILLMFLPRCADREPLATVVVVYCCHDRNGCMFVQLRIAAHGRLVEQIGVAGDTSRCGEG